MAGEGTELTAPDETLQDTLRDTPENGLPSVEVSALLGLETETGSSERERTHFHRK